MNPRLHFYIYLNDVKPPLHNTNNYQKHKLKNQNSPKKPIKGPREDVQYFCELFPQSSYLQRGKVEILFHLPKFGPRVEKRKASTKSTPVKKNKKAKLENANKSKRKASLTQSTPIKNKKAKSEKKK